MKIAVSGKGGVGKTTISAMLARHFAANGYNVYAVDADPDSCLGLALGIRDEILADIKPIIEMREMIGDKVGNGALYTLNPLVNDTVEKYSIDADGIRFLRMGGVKKGGSECYCRENTFLKALVNSLLLDTNDAVIMDMGAGIEHLTRGTSSGMDLMIIVTEPSKASIQTARTVEALAKDIGIQKVRFIANKIRTEKEAQYIKDSFKSEELLGLVHFDEAISERAMGMNDARPLQVNNEITDILNKVVKKSF